MNDSSEKIPYLGKGFRAKWGNQPEIEKTYQDGVSLIKEMLAEYGVESVESLPEAVKQQLEAKLGALNVVVTPGDIDE